jgi:hypothetical protein
MKKFNTEIIIDATHEQLACLGITEEGFAGQKMRAWDFNTISVYGPCAMVYHYYNEEDFFVIPMRYIKFIDLTIEDATFIWPDAMEANTVLMPGLSVDQHISHMERKYMFTEYLRAVYYEVGTNYQLRVILSQEAHRYRLIENFMQELRAMNLNPVCEDEGIRLEYTFNDSLQPWVSKLLNTYVGFWRSIAIKVNHDRENRLARYYIKYQLITGKDLTDDQLIRAVEYVQKRI